jgi:type II restriction/modification system DNA methylase subunit YeeA
MFVIDFGIDMDSEEAALFELPFEYVRKHVLPKRENLRRTNHRDNWWIHGEARPGFRKKLLGKTRYAATARHGKHRFFIWLDVNIIPDSALAVVPRDDDYFFGVLSSLIHEIWARSQGTQVREVESGFRYTPKSCFDTFPFPYPPGTEPSEADSPIVHAIADAARELVRLRDNWLNPTDISESDLKDRTLTKLYNKRPEWLANAHRTLDEAVFAAYGWPADLSDQEILARLLALNHERAAAQQPS